MKIEAYRTTMPFDNREPGNGSSISPSTPKSVIPTNNVFTVQDALEGKKYTLPGGGGDWSDGDEASTPSYKDEGDSYKRQERDMEILRRMTQPHEKPTEKWKVQVPGGFATFMSLPLAQQFQKKLKDQGHPVASISRVASSTSITKQADTVQTVYRSIDKCFMVESIDYDSGTKETGSAFVIGPQLLMTCAHVIKPYNKTDSMQIPDYSGLMLKVSQNGQSLPATLVNVSLEWDLAIIKAEIDVEPFELDTTPTLGEDIVVISSPHGFENNISTGTLGAGGREIYFYEGAPEYMFVDLSVFPGSSGGPVIKEDNGKVVGMVTLIVGGDESDYGLNACLPSSYIKEFLGVNSSN